MKIAVLGYSGCGKSTLAARLGKKHDIPVLHMDTIQFLPGWVVRPMEEKQRLMLEFLDGNDQWVIDGNYSALYQPRRLAEADQIVLMEFNRFACLFRAWKRYRKYRGQARSSMAEGCPEKMDAAFVRWILWEGRTRRKNQAFRDIEEKYPGKVTVIRNQRQLDDYMRRGNVPAEETGG